MNLLQQCRALYATLPAFVRYAIPLILAFTIFLWAESIGQAIGRALYHLSH